MKPMASSASSAASSIRLMTFFLAETGTGGASYSALGDFTNERGRRHPSAARVLYRHVGLLYCLGRQLHRNSSDVVTFGAT